MKCRRLTRMGVWIALQLIINNKLAKSYDHGLLLEANTRCARSCGCPCASEDTFTRARAHFTYATRRVKPGCHKAGEGGQEVVGGGGQGHWDKSS
jgi:hypothetical protein